MNSYYPKCVFFKVTLRPKAELGEKYDKNDLRHVVVKGRNPCECKDKIAKRWPGHEFHGIGEITRVF